MYSYTYYRSPLFPKAEFSGLSVTLNSFLTMLLKISGFVKFLTLSGRNRDSCVIVTHHTEKSFGERGRKSWSSLKKSENLQGDDEVEED